MWLPGCAPGWPAKAMSRFMASSGAGCAGGARCCRELLLPRPPLLPLLLLRVARAAMLHARRATARRAAAAAIVRLRGGPSSGARCCSKCSISLPFLYSDSCSYSCPIVAAIAARGCPKRSDDQIDTNTQFSNCAVMLLPREAFQSNMACTQTILHIPVVYDLCEGVRAERFRGESAPSRTPPRHRQPLRGRERGAARSSSHCVCCMMLHDSFDVIAAPSVCITGFFNKKMQV